MGMGKLLVVLAPRALQHKLLQLVHEDITRKEELRLLAATFLLVGNLARCPRMMPCLRCLLCQEGASQDMGTSTTVPGGCTHVVQCCGCH